MGISRASALLALLLSLTVQSGTVIESIVAKIDGAVILYSEIQQEGALLNLENGIPLQAPLSTALKERILDTIIVRIMLQEEARDRAIPVGETAVSELLATYEKIPQLTDFLARFELSAAEFRTIVKQRVTARIVTDDLIARTFKGKVTPSEEEKKKAIEKWIDSLRKKHRIVYYSLP